MRLEGKGHRPTFRLPWFGLAHSEGQKCLAGNRFFFIALAYFHADAPPRPEECNNCSRCTAGACMRRFWAVAMGLCCRNMPFFQGLPGSAAYGPTLYWYAPLRERAALLLNARNGPRVVEPQNRQPGDRGVSVERRSRKVRPRAISARRLEAARSTRHREAFVCCWCDMGYE